MLRRALSPAFDLLDDVLAGTEDKCGCKSRPRTRLKLSLSARGSSHESCRILSVLFCSWHGARVTLLKFLRPNNNSDLLLVVGCREPRQVWTWNLITFKSHEKRERRVGRMAHLPPKIIENRGTRTKSISTTRIVSRSDFRRCARTAKWPMFIHMYTTWAQNNGSGRADRKLFWGIF